MKNRKESIIAILKAMDNDVLVDVWNEYCQEQNMDDYIYNNDEYTLQDMFGGSENPVNEALRAAFYGNYRYSDDYVMFDAYANLKSFDEYDVENNIDFDTLADYIMNNDCREIQEVWIEDIHGDFEDYFNNKFEDVSIDEDYDLSSWNLLTEDWDDIAQEVLDEIKDNENENKS